MTRKFGLIGYPLGHSFSRQYHNERFARLGIDAIYNNYELPDISQLPQLIASDSNIEGLNVTIPYKEAVIPYLDKIDETARAIGAINVIRITRRNGQVQLEGYNTDYIGFARSFTPLLKGVKHHKALVLGTGGASKAIAAALQNMGIAVTKVSRHPTAGQLAYSELSPAVMASHTVIVNATPVGMYPATDACPPVPYELITPAHICYDAIYNPTETTFMKRAAMQGATVSNGLQMLYGQADAAWEIWNS